jgi:UDP-glucuronate 4-epimerase
VKVKKLDLAEREMFRLELKQFKPDTVIHLAAQPGVRTPLGKSYQYIQNNIVAFSNVLQIVVEENIPNFLYASSSSVYGNCLNIPYKENDLSIQPISIYGATKLANEILTQPYIQGSKTRARGMRFFTVYGPWGRPDMAYLRLIDSILNGSKFSKYGDGEVKRDFTYIDDITNAIEQLAIELTRRPEAFSDIVNIGGGNPHSLNDLMQVISQELGSSPNVAETPSNPNDTNLTNADVSKLQSLISRPLFVELETGVKSTIAWAKKEGIRENLTSWVNSTN